MKQNSKKINEMIKTIRELRCKIKKGINPECTCINCLEQKEYEKIKFMTYNELWKNMENAEEKGDYNSYYKVQKEVCERNESLVKVLQENNIKNIKEVIEFLKK